MIIIIITEYRGKGEEEEEGGGGGDRIKDIVRKVGEYSGQDPL
jgi:hypothetical protein